MPEKTMAELIAIYGYVFAFSEGLAVTFKNGKWFHIRPDGMPAYEQRFDFVSSFYKGLARACQNNEWFNIHPDGTRAI